LEKHTRMCLLRLHSLLCTVIFLILAIPVSWGQATGDPKEDFLYGEYYLAQGLFHEALPFYLSSLEHNPDNSNINYRIGLCYTRILGEQQNALPYLKKAILEINNHYIDGKYNNTGAPAEAWLLLGDAYLRDDQLLEASRAYHIYKDLIGTSDPEKYEVIMKRISGLGVSYEYQRDQQDIALINMGANINSRFSDYNPVLSGDQKVLIYTQYWESYDRILMSLLGLNGWSVAEDISSKVGSDGSCYSSAISFDGKQLFLVCHDEMAYDIYVSNYTQNGWTKMKPITGKINSRYRESSMSISADGKTIYFASDKPGGEGGFDIYMAQREGSEWTEIENIGKPINTSGNEEAPYISYDGRVLYFSSNGHETVGNMDVLYSELDESENWKEPVNMGVPINTTNDEVFFVYFKDTKTGYHSRDLPEGMGKNDIYRIQTGKPVTYPTDGVVIEKEYDPVMVLSGEKESLPKPDLQEIKTDKQESTGTSEIALQHENVTQAGQNTSGNNSVKSPETNPVLPVAGNNSVTAEDNNLSQQEIAVGTAEDQRTSSQKSSEAGLNNSDLALNNSSSKGSSESAGLSSPNQQTEVNSNTSSATAGNMEGNKPGATQSELNQDTKSQNTDVTDQTQIQNEGEANLKSESVPTSNNNRDEMSGGKNKAASGSQKSETEKGTSGAENPSSSDYRSGGKVTPSENYNKPTDTDAKSVSAPNESVSGNANVDNTVTPSLNTTQEKGQEGTRGQKTAQTKETDNKNKSGNTGTHTKNADVALNESEVVNEDMNPGEREKYEGHPDIIKRNDVAMSNEKESDSLPTYTIQIYALRNPIDPKKIRLSPLLISSGTDGLYRYTYGEYLGYSNALQFLYKIRETGFPDAFIRNITTIQNYSGRR
jgi:hypothetical protein